MSASSPKRGSSVLLVVGNDYSPNSSLGRSLQKSKTVSGEDDIAADSSIPYACENATPESKLALVTSVHH